MFPLCDAAGSGYVVPGSVSCFYATLGYIKYVVLLANGADGFLLDNVFLVELDGLQGNQNGGYGLQFLGFHTTVQARNCQGYANVLGGWKINDMMYSSFDSCAADLNNVHWWENGREAGWGRGGPTGVDRRGGV